MSDNYDEVAECGDVADAMWPIAILRLRGTQTEVTMRRVLSLLLLVPALSCGGNSGRTPTPTGGLIEQAIYGEAAAKCSHDPCATGGKLGKSCGTCVSQICSADTFCCD